MSGSCCAKSDEVMIPARSGGSTTGRPTSWAAGERTREGSGTMFCLAGLGGGLSGCIKSVQDTSRVIVLLVLVFAACLPVLGYAAPVPTVPAQGMVTMVDLGAKACIPCKMMMPVMDAVEKEYAGKASIVFIDVWENPDQKQKFGLKAIPTQIFYDKQGKEVFRHEGFFDKKSISEILDKLLSQ